MNDGTLTLDKVLPYSIGWVMDKAMWAVFEGSRPVVWCDSWKMAVRTQLMLNREVGGKEKGKSC